MKRKSAEDTSVSSNGVMSPEQYLEGLLTKAPRTTEQGLNDLRDALEALGLRVLCTTTDIETRQVTITVDDDPEWIGRYLREGGNR